MRWSAPAEWRSPEGYALHLSMPLIAPVHGGTLWLGQMLSIRKGTNELLWPFAAPGATALTNSSQLQIGAVVGSDGGVRYVPMPADQVHWIVSPRAAVDQRGTTHLMWAPSDSNRPRKILYASFDGQRWTAPQVVAESHRVFWDWGNTSPLVLQGDTVHLFVNFSEGLLYVRGVRGSWLTRHVDLLHDGVTGGYPRLTVLPNGRLVLLLQGTAPNTPKSNKPGLQVTSRVYATWSDDGGVTWSRPRPVSALGMEPAFDFHLLRGADGVLRALWYQMTDTLGNPAQQMSLSGAPGRVHMAESRDGGESWRPLRPTALLHSAGSLDAQLVGDSTVVIVLVDREAEEVLLATWSNGWQPFSHIEAKPNPQQTILGRDDAQRLVLTWGSERGSPRWFLSMVSTLTSCR